MKKIILALISGFVCLSAYSQLQSASEFLGYELGTKFTRHHKVVDYINHVAEETPEHPGRGRRRPQRNVRNSQRAPRRAQAWQCTVP